MSSPDTSIPILAISLFGIITTSILLITYHFFRKRHASSGILEEMFVDQIHGLDESVIRSIPIIQFAGSGGGHKTKNLVLRGCAVCLAEFQREEKLRLLPACSHAFHIDCIDTWLQNNPNCPLCRTEITCNYPFQSEQFMTHCFQTNESVVVEVKDDVSLRSHQRIVQQQNKTRRVQRISFMGDECIGVRNKGEDISVLRRSFSMDSSLDRQLYMVLQGILQKKQHKQSEETIAITERSHGDILCGAVGSDPGGNSSFMSTKCTSHP